MIDAILKMYWTPKGTPLWKLHLPSILIATVLLCLLVISGIKGVYSLIPLFLGVVISQVVLAIWARARYGDTEPRN
jgi:hypothetical protein